MSIHIKVFPRAKKNILKKEAGQWKAAITAPAIDGKANKALIKLLADYFEVPKGRIQITKGLKSRLKTISIEGI